MGRKANGDAAKSEISRLSLLASDIVVSTSIAKPGRKRGH